MANNSLTVPAFPSSNSPQRIATDNNSVRVKVALKPGRSLMDWIRLGRSGQDLTGVGGQILNVTEEELAKHNTQDDGWLAIRGKVYNVSPYMEYHPGGIDELKRGLGKDATQLFDEIHKWVNAESMLEKCFVGRLQTSINPRKGSTASKTSVTSGKLSANGNLNIASLKPPEPIAPRFDWYQTMKSINLVVYTKWMDMKPEYVIIKYHNKELLMNINIKEYTFLVHLELEDEIEPDYVVKVQKDGKVEIILPLIQLENKWNNIGKPLEKHCMFKKTSEIDVQYHDCNIEYISSINHDTKLFALRLARGSWMCVPIGYHIHIHHNISGMDIVRSYTCVMPSLIEDEPSSTDQLLYLMIKIYTDGTFTPWLNQLSIGDSIKISYYDGNFNNKYLQQEDIDLIMYAAGTGFTPMIRLINETIKSHSTIKSAKLLFFNKKRKDILWKDQLDQLAANSNNRFEVVYILSEAESDWTGLQGRIRSELINNYIPKVDKDSNILVCACGPTPFTKEVIRLAKEHGCQESQLHAFIG